ncbi:Bifunctional ligase/repressor BirA [Frondihabitans sp. 762G35]|uniref:biotin--[acetyl-CoA-carboxylase] ligase n=1 Tax=Frondihabitans sp. 762G35 TaxID=1446794 RepID=UPI000D20219D|nr:biotin--[acetyl-CoA-carboxylase] ligase [Frondihabitans sp. 762G35]ARC57451.1 Bifunctional ligase/repressor BirA [Frondihabitans sp. 762G35]
MTGSPPSGSGEAAQELPDGFALSRRVVPRLVHLGVTGSTNDDLVLRAPTAPAGTVVVSLEQRAGRGRLARAWTAPAGQMMAASILVRPRDARGAALPEDAWGWLPLLAGHALEGGIQELLDGVPEARPVLLKWPNDVQIGGDKVSGILAEVTTVDGAPDGVVVGVGVNLTIARPDLPTAVSTSLRLEGVEGEAVDVADRVLSSFVARFGALLDRLASASGDATASGLHREVEAACDTVGRRVRVELPDGTDLHGRATGLDPAGRLVVLPDDKSGIVRVAAGDVTHLRYE